MEIWQIWVSIALFLVFVEIITVGFAAICLSFGALGATIAACFTDSLAWQISIFAFITLISFIYIRPIIKRLVMKEGKNYPKSGVDALIGKTAIVEEDIIPEKNCGRVTIDGDSWKAVSENGEPVKKGERVSVIRIDSIILTIRKI